MPYNACEGRPAELVRAARDVEEVGSAPVRLRQLVNAAERDAAQRAREAARAALGWWDRTRPGAETVCMIHPENLASARVAARLGYREFARSAYKGEAVILLSRRGGEAAQES